MSKYKAYSYIVDTDSGFAPNPFGGICTLACCKPDIRKFANIGDWVFGFAPKRHQNALVYAMQVTKTELFGGYFSKMEYQHKKPSQENRYGDNIYQEIHLGIYAQIENYNHSCDMQEDDLKSTRVLISDNFYYFGKNAPAVPLKFDTLIKKEQGHKCTNLDDTIIQDFLKWLNKDFEKGIHGEPRDNKSYLFDVASELS